jgi:hypothetical protein
MAGWDGMFSMTFQGCLRPIAPKLLHAVLESHLSRGRNARSGKGLEIETHQKNCS